MGKARVQMRVEFIGYPDGYHGFLRAGYPAHRADVLTRTVGWFRDHLDMSDHR